jgi:hypothetical protein
LLQTFFGWPDLVFNIDHRYLLMHAWSIQRAEGASEALTMAGTAIRYHSGPAWLAAAAGSILEREPNVFLFLWFPAVAVATIALGVHRILRGLGAPFVGALFGFAFALTPPWAHIRFGGGTRRALREAASWNFAAAGDWFVSLFFNPSFEMMLNSLLGTAIILAAIAMHVTKRSIVSLFLAAATIALAAATKPQYALSGALLLLAIGLSTADRDRIPLTLVLAVPAASAIAGLVLGIALSGVAAGSTSGSSGFTVAFPTDWRVVRPFLLSDPQFLFGTMGLAVLFLTRRALPEFARYVLRFGSVLAVSMLGFWLLLTTLTQDPSGGNKEWAWNSMQTLQPVGRILTAAVAAALYSLLAQVAVRFALVPLALILIASTSSGIHLIADLTDPLSGHEVVDAAEIRTLLAEIDPLDALIVVSDLSDPAQDHRREGKAFYLSNPYGHRYWLTQTGVGHQFLAETSERLEQLEAFFGAPWSSWHEQFLLETDITHVAVNTRCPSAWNPEDTMLLKLVKRTESWAIYRVDPQMAVSIRPSEAYAQQDIGTRSLDSPAISTEQPGFGFAPCR